MICLTKPIREEAITSLYCNTVPRSLAVADLGCSSGPNTLLVVSEFIKIVEKLCRELNHKSPEYKVFLNDLPGNDFNNIFKSLDSFKEKLCDEMESGIGPCYFSGVPGSFYGRVFPNQSLHFVHSSYSLQWLSKVHIYIYCLLLLVLEVKLIKISDLGSVRESVTSIYGLKNYAK